MWWVVVPVLLCTVGLGAAAVRVRRNQQLQARLDDLAGSGQHGEVLDQVLPTGSLQESARATQVTSAVRSGRYLQALDLLAESADDGTSPPARGTSRAASLRAAALIGLGRYPEVERLLGDQPPMGALRRLRARAAIEVGDDSLAEDLLTDAYADPLEEAERQRLLGDLSLRRGRSSEGERLVRTARATYAGSGTAADQVDAALCTLIVARGRLAAGAPAEAWPLVRSALEGLAARPDEAPPLATAHALAARVRAALDDGTEAGTLLAIAQGHASRCQSPPLDAEIVRATALVALDLGDLEVARRLLLEAIAAHDQLGARPVVADLRARLAELSG